MLQRRLRRDEDAADVDGDQAIHLFQRRLLERLRHGRAGVVHQHIQTTKARDGLLDRPLDRFGVGGIRLNRDCPPAVALDCLHDR